MIRQFILLLVCFGIGCAREPRDQLLPGENFSRQEALAGAELGKPLIEAIFRFESETGCWPQDLNELTPQYLTTVDNSLWRYHTFNHDDFSVVYLGRVTGGLVRFDHEARKPDAWNACWEDDREQWHSEKLAIDAPRPAPANLTADERGRKKVALLSKRIESMPNRIGPRVGLMGHYFGLSKYDEARTVCVGCIEKWPDYWWSYLMLAKIDSQRGDLADAERRLVGLAKRWDDFFGYVFLAQFHFDCQQAEKSKQALRDAIKPPLTRHKEKYEFEQIGWRESWIDDSYYHNAAHLAYRMGDRELCLAVCDQWRRFVKEIQGYGGQEEFGLRIVCFVNDGNWDRAKRTLEAMKQDSGYAAWQDEGIRRHGEIIQEKNAKFIYDPNLFRKCGPPLNVEFNYK